jgi:hypothetical protein
MVTMWRATAVPCVEIGRCIAGRWMLPTPEETPVPFEREGPDGILMRGTLVALLQRVGMGLEGVGDGFGSHSTDVFAGK